MAELMEAFRRAGSLERVVLHQSAATVAGEKERASKGASILPANVNAETENY